MLNRVLIFVFFGLCSPQAFSLKMKWFLKPSPLKKMRMRKLIVGSSFCLQTRRLFASEPTSLPFIGTFG